MTNKEDSIKVGVVVQSDNQVESEVGLKHQVKWHDNWRNISFSFIFGSEKLNLCFRTRQDIAELKFKIDFFTFFSCKISTHWKMKLKTFFWVYFFSMSYNYQRSYFLPTKSQRNDIIEVVTISYWQERRWLLSGRMYFREFYSDKIGKTTSISSRCASLDNKVSLLSPLFFFFYLFDFDDEKIYCKIAKFVIYFLAECCNWDEGKREREIERKRKENKRITVKHFVVCRIFCFWPQKIDFIKM